MEDRIKLARKNFDSYYYSFSNLSENHKRNFRIKYDHSIRVSEICGTIADNLKLNTSDKTLAITIGLFHDIGRFKQLIDYNTFNDATSIDHAACSVKVLQENNMLLDFKDADTIYAAIQHHNKLKIPDHLAGRELFFAQLIRDADKLDILKVITDYYTAPMKKANHTLTWEMPAGQTVSHMITEQILAGEQISRANIKNQLDIKVMQLSWVFDLNFKPSLEILKEKGYINIIANCLPQNKTTDKITEKVFSFLNQTIKATVNPAD
ncbi:HD domain-containing protein [Plebeiibacterium marinum]|uniref:HD domain-containing protein n=1 Tax=Plebeiibacterium marinum TaxID=2992111 RepID=A0AAE3MBV1_9BACT|nr:HD domain-containing protein [Plebeiobacterium marinum]MCW3804657.1 HD domain-containing protein [Plebeiobacterium marinum]